MREGETEKRDDEQRIAFRNVSIFHEVMGGGSVCPDVFHGILLLMRTY